MPSGKPPLLIRIEELQKQITALRGDITEIKELLLRCSEVVMMEKPEIPFEVPVKDSGGWFF